MIIRRAVAHAAGARPARSFARRVPSVGRTGAMLPHNRYSGKGPFPCWIVCSRRSASPQRPWPRWPAIASPTTRSPGCKPTWRQPSAADLNLIRAEDLAARLDLDEGPRWNCWQPRSTRACSICIGMCIARLHRERRRLANLAEAQSGPDLCPNCQAHYDVHLDDHVAVRFSLNPRYGPRWVPPPDPADQAARQQQGYRAGPAERAGVPRSADRSAAAAP